MRTWHFYCRTYVEQVNPHRSRRKILGGLQSILVGLGLGFSLLSTKRYDPGLSQPIPINANRRGLQKRDASNPELPTTHDVTPPGSHRLSESTPKPPSPCSRTPELEPRKRPIHSWAPDGRRTRRDTVNLPRSKKLVKVSMTCEKRQRDCMAPMTITRLQCLDCTRTLQFGGVLSTCLSVQPHGVVLSAQTNDPWKGCKDRVLWTLKRTLRFANRDASSRSFRHLGVSIRFLTHIQASHACTGVRPRAAGRGPRPRPRCSAVMTPEDGEGSFSLSLAQECYKGEDM